MLEGKDTPTPSATIEGIIEGRMVHYVLSNGEHRPGIIVKVWSKSSGCSNLQVFVDNTNDAPAFIPPIAQVTGVYWVTSANYSEEPTPRTWHFIER